MSQSEFRQSVVQLQNQRRARHGAAALRSAGDLERSAQAWAEALAAKGGLENSAEAKRGECGECISMRSAAGQLADITADEVVSQWYKDIEKYDFAEGTGKAGNFTQMVWVGTREVGVGKVQRGDRVVVVAHYRPPGNVRGRYVANVRPADSGAGAAPAGSNGSPPPASAASPAGTLSQELAGCRVTKRDIEREEVQEGGRLFIVERERIRYEDEHGNPKEKIVERRREEVRLPPPPAAPKPPPPPPATQPPSEGGHVLEATESEAASFVQEVLQRHNEHRTRHGASELALSVELTVKAQAFAAELCGKAKLYNSGATHSGDRLGENIASRWSNGPTDYKANEVVDHWYNEVEKYRYKEEPSDIKGIGNFTQVVWKGSKELGVGKAIHKNADGSHKAVVVCYYHPSGNVMKSFGQNVSPPASQ